MVFVVGDGVGRLKWYEWTGNTNTWAGHDLIGIDVVHGHGLALADIDEDGNLDIFCAEMGKWSNNAPVPDNPEAAMWVFLGDGDANFTAKVIASGCGNHESKAADPDGDGDIDILGKPYKWGTPRLDIRLNSRANSQPAGGQGSLPNLTTSHTIITTYNTKAPPVQSHWRSPMCAQHIFGFKSFVLLTRRGKGVNLLILPTGR